MEYITIIQDDIELGSSHQYLRIPHPRTGLPQLYLPSTSNGSEILSEVVKIQGSHRRTWFIGDSKIDAGTILIHYAIDPLYLVIPMIMSLLSSHSSNNPPPFQPLSDLLSAVSSSSDWALPEAWTKSPPNDKANGFNEDIDKLLKLKSVRKTFRLCCERKVISNAPPSPSDSPGEHSQQPSKQVYYRPSLPVVLKLLQRKVEYIANPSQFEMFDHLVRGLGKDGLAGVEIDQKLVRLARMKASCEHLQQWLALEVSTALSKTYEFARLDEYLANRASAIAAASAPIINGGKEGAKGGTKRKAPPASRGVEALKKVNTSSMSKLTSFFKPKEGKK